MIGLLEEVWTTLMEVCEFSGDPQYHLDVEKTRDLMKRVEKAKASFMDTNASTCEASAPPTSA